MEKEKLKKNEVIITRLWASSGKNMVLKIPMELFDERILKLERNIKLVPQKKGYLMTNIE